MWLGRLEVWLVCIEMCCKYIIHSKFQRLSMKNEYISLIIFYYILQWHFGYNGLNKILSKVILSVSYYLFKCDKL